jgi:hypothetical protein
MIDSSDHASPHAPEYHSHPTEISAEMTPGTEHIYGRDEELRAITAHLDDQSGQTTVVLLIGDGGTGKTRLAQALTATLKSRSCIFSPLYDFYHVDNFRSSAIEGTIEGTIKRECVRPYPDAFAAYQAQREKLEHIRQSGSDFEAAQMKVREAFVECYNNVAALEQRAGRKVVLLFDTVEQAVSLTDDAEKRLKGDNLNANAGGEHWLLTMLPQLKNTLAVLLGRELTLYGTDVTLYKRLAEHVSSIEIPLKELRDPDFKDFALELRRQLTHSPDAQTREVAQSLPTDEVTLSTWYRVSGGLPFWVSLLITCAQLGGDVVDTVQDYYLDHNSFDGIDEQTTHALRKEVIQRIFNDMRHRKVSPETQRLFLALQWMASLRKGMTQDLLSHLISSLLPEQTATFNAPRIFERLKDLLVVKQRTVRQYGSDGTPHSTVFLFLHDEMYNWFDQEDTKTLSSRQEVIQAVLDWYEQQIAAVGKALAGLREMQLGMQPLPPTATLETIKEQYERLLKQNEQLFLDKLGYCYRYDHDAGTLHGREEYNLASYTAIHQRAFGYGITIRQEGLRNLHHIPTGIPFAINVECAARWIMRAVFAEDRTALQMLDRLNSYYAQERAHPGMHFGYLRLAEAQARLSFSKDTPHHQIENLFEQAEASIRGDAAAQSMPRWHDFLLAQLMLWRGYFYRLNYSLYEAIQFYHSGLALAEGHAPLFPQLRGELSNNLGFAYSEQGDISDARQYVQAGLELNQLSNSDMYIGLSYNSSALVELQADHPWRAKELAQYAREIFEKIGSNRGLSMCLPVLARAYRKAAEENPDDLRRQEEDFKRTLELLEEAYALMERHNIQVPEHRRVLYQGLGCAYRTYAQTLYQRSDQSPRVREYFQQAEHWLKEALDVAPTAQPALVRMDLYEDLAVTYINQDRFDSRIEDILASAESLAEEQYRILEGTGLRPVENAVKAYWRELGQIQIQRMLMAFGVYDFGFSQKSGAASTGKGDPLYLRAAAEHMLLGVTYLAEYRFGSEAPCLTKAEKLIVRELRLNRSMAELNEIRQAITRAADRYNLRNTLSMHSVEKLVQQVQTKRNQSAGR